MTNRYLESAKSALRRIRKHTRDSAVRDEITSVIGDIDRGSYTYEQTIRDAKMIGVRNPAFDGDYIGYLNDDFENENKPDDDDDSK